jgi:hypothetical protein
MVMSCAKGSLLLIELNWIARESRCKAVWKGMNRFWESRWPGIQAVNQFSESDAVFEVCKLPFFDDHLTNFGTSGTHRNVIKLTASAAVLVKPLQPNGVQPDGETAQRCFVGN